MGYNERTIGGKPVSGTAQGIEDIFSSWLGIGQGGLSPEDRTMGIGRNIGLLAEGFMDPNATGGMREIMQRNIDRNAQEISTRYSGLGMAGGGTPAGIAEAKFRGEAAPQIAVAQQQMINQALAALAPLFGGMMQWGSMGMPQAQTVMQPDWAMNLMNSLGGMAQGAGNIMSGIGALKGFPTQVG